MSSTEALPNKILPNNDLEIIEKIENDNHNSYELMNINEFKVEYDIIQNFNLLFSITKIDGSKKHPNDENYLFNKMKSFSHYRLELKYFF